MLFTKDFFKFFTSFWCRSSFSCFALIFKNIQRANAGMMVVLCKSECCLNCLRRCDDVMHTVVQYMFYRYLMCLMIVVGGDSFDIFDDDLIFHFRFELLAFHSVIPARGYHYTGTKLNKLPFLLNSNSTPTQQAKERRKSRQYILQITYLSLQQNRRTDRTGQLSLVVFSPTFYKYT